MLRKSLTQNLTKFEESESLVTGDTVDKLAPHGIFVTKDDGHKSLKLK